MRGLRFALAGALLLATPASAQSLWDRFVDPPADARPMVRWWWFGPAVTDGELDREIRAMKAGGFGGFEVQPTYPLSPDDPDTKLVNIPYLSDAFVARLAHAGATARAEGMRIDVTVGTGWPFGGPAVPITEAAADIRRVELALPAGAAKARLPALPAGFAVVAAFLDGRRLALTGDRIALEPSAAARTIALFVAGRTGQQVKRAALGGEGFVIDHADAAAVRHYLGAVGDRLLQAFPKASPPYAMFSDSLEAYGSSWTGDLPAEFRRRRGYDLLDHLPALFDDLPESAAVRYDWGRTLSELVDERYLAPIAAWAKAHGTRFRAQVYGFPPPMLSSNALVDLPEGEGADWRQFSATRWATSAAHLYGRPVVSSETWTWLHSPAWAATPLDMKVEADRHFLQGVNQLIGHGWPYSPPGAAEPGWAFYAAAALNDHNPWYPAMPAVTRYLARVSAMLREGQPANPVAIYLPSEDALAEMKPARGEIREALTRRLSERVVGQVLDAGFGFDFVDARAIVAGKLDAHVLVLPGLHRIDAAAYRAIADWSAKGGIVIALDRAPDASGGLLDGARATAEVRATGRRIFARKGNRTVAEGALGKTLMAAATPDMALAAPDPQIGFVHRKLADGDLYFVANTGNRPVATAARFAGDNKRGAWWNPQTGTRWAAGTGAIPIRLAPYETRFLVFGAEAPATGAAPFEGGRVVTDLSRDWTVARPGEPERAVAQLGFWKDPGYSGAVVYRRSFTLDASPARRLVLDFGAIDPQQASGDTPARPRAQLAVPVREAALVSINGKPAGTLWAPPYRLDITNSVKAGRNEITIKVMNGALNALATRGRIDQSVLRLRYGVRFDDQDVDKIAPQPSGLTGPVTLVAE